MSKGLPIESLRTPALLVDIDIMEANLATMAAFFTNTSCRLRPHFKNHKCIALAKKQLAAGAIGITTATLRETEMLVNGGITSILLANEVAGDANLQWLLELAEKGDVIAAVDNVKTVDDIARLLNGKKSDLSLVVDIDLGMARCGTIPGQTVVDLGKHIVDKGLKFAGIMGYEGHLQRLTLTEENMPVRKHAMQQLNETRKCLEAAGIPVSIVSAGGTGTYSIGGAAEGITEIQAGNYLLMDTSYAPFAPHFMPSLTLLATVISVTPGERFIVNAGIKEISGERGLPLIKNIPGAVLKALHAEHGIVTYKDATNMPQVGDAVELAPYYSDGTVNLHRKLYGIRNGIVEEVFAIG